MFIKEIMTEDFEVVPHDQTLDEAVELMLGNRVDHVFIVEDGRPKAMITRRKALVACYKTDAALSSIPVSGFSSGLETQVGPNETVLIAVGKLRQAKESCLPVVNGMEVEGVVTKDDILENLSNITKDTIEKDEQKDEWTV